MARLCQWLLAVNLLFVLVTAGPVEIQKRRGVSLPLNYGVSSASNTRRGERSPSSIIADLKIQLERLKRKYSDEPLLPDSGVPLHERVTSGSVNLTDIVSDSSYFASVKVGTPRKFYPTAQLYFTQIAHAVFHSAKL